MFAKRQILVQQSLSVEVYISFECEVNQVFVLLMDNYRYCNITGTLYYWQVLRVSYNYALRRSCKFSQINVPDGIVSKIIKIFLALSVSGLKRISKCW